MTATGTSALVPAIAEFYRAPRGGVATVTAVFALVITGAPGAGKTAVLGALTDALVAADIRHAVIEADAPTSAHPPLDDVRWPMPVRAIGADEHAVVRLEAEPATLRARIVEREPESFPQLEQLVAASARLGPVIAGLDGIALALTTEGRRPEAVAEGIRDAWPDKLRAGRR